VERRAALRYQLAAPVGYSWEGMASNEVKGSGMTRDVSMTGAYITTDTCPPVESSVQLTIFLTRRPGVASTVQIKGQGRVIRVDRGEKVAAGFAVVSQGFILYSRGDPVVDSLDLLL
jgi:hypothetical protein